MSALRRSWSLSVQRISKPPTVHSALIQRWVRPERNEARRRSHASARRPAETNDVALRIDMSAFPLAVTRALPIRAHA